MAAPDVTTVEVHFAQRLASNETKIRNRALGKLTKWLQAKSCSGEDAFNEADFIKLWKGLHYCLWMQDKPLLQEELTGRIARLIHAFKNEQCSLLFWTTFLQTEIREWDLIDKWRVDKFMMLVRTMLNQTFICLRSQQWSRKVILQFTDIISNQILNTSLDTIPESLRIHFSDVYLDELEKTGAAQLTSEQVICLLEPFFQFLSQAKNMDVLKRIISSVFQAISKQSVDDAVEAAKRQLEKEGIDENDEEEDTEMTNEDQDVDLPLRLNYDFDAIASRLFQVGSDKKCIGRNRSVIFDLVTTFRDLDKGVFTVEEVIPPGISKRLRAQEKKVQYKKKKLKEKKKLKAAETQTASAGDGCKNQEIKNVVKENGSCSMLKNAGENGSISNEKLYVEKNTSKSGKKSVLQDKNCDNTTEGGKSLSRKRKNNIEIQDKNCDNATEGGKSLSRKRKNNIDGTVSDEVIQAKQKKKVNDYHVNKPESNSLGSSSNKKNSKLKSKQKDDNNKIVKIKNYHDNLVQEKFNKNVNSILKNESKHERSFEEPEKMSGDIVSKKSISKKKKNNQSNSTETSAHTDVLIDGEVDIWIPSKKYKGKLKGLYEKELENRNKGDKLSADDTTKETSNKRKESSVRSFAKFDHLLKTPPAFVRRALARAVTPMPKCSKSEKIFKTV